MDNQPLLAGFKKTEEQRWSREQVLAVIAWPVICLAVASIVWVVALTRIAEHREQVERNAVKTAVALSKAYSEQLARTVQQIDSVTLNIKYQWEKNGERLDLQDELKKGLFPAPRQFYLTVANRHGIGVTSSLGGPPIDLSDRAYFNHHRLTREAGLYIDPQLSVGRRSGRTVVRFTRRLEKADGTFDGVVSVGVEPDFLSTFNDEGNLNPHDFISVRHTDGALLVSEKGHDIRGAEVHIHPPVFKSDQGVMRVSKENYKDGDARILAWHKLDGYPLVSYVGLSEQDLFIENKNIRVTYTLFAIVFTAILFIVALVGSILSGKSAARKRQVAEIRKTYQLAIDQAREAFFMVRAVYSSERQLDDFVIEDCNSRGASMVGHTKRTIIGCRLSELALLQPLAIAFPKFLIAMETGFHEEEFQVHDHQTERPIWINRRLVRSGDGLAVTLRDISDIKNKEALLVMSANTDPLTKLPNRYWLINALPAALSGAERLGHSFAILFIDLDNFKMVNDKMGHAVGDTLLQLAAARLQAQVRADDKVVRLGGDEFTVLLSTVSHIDEVRQIAMRINEAFLQPFYLLNQSLLIGTSVGISMFPEDGVEANALIQKADIAMYASKSAGKGTYRFYNDELYERIRSRLDAEEELAAAIAGRAFDLHYQPRVNTFTAELIGLEALVRWRHPQRGMISPAEFIALAEETGSIVPLGELILDLVLSQVARWRDAGVPLVPVSINISPRQLDAGNVDQRLSALMTQYGVPASLIEVELTESAMMSQVQSVVEQLSGMRKLGIKLHLDDFGTGYSSLPRLQEIDMQVVKIDRAFISKLGLSPQADVLVRTIVSMADGLKMEVIAEGIETRAQLDLLRQMGCREAQGYFFSKPLPATEVETLLYRGTTEQQCVATLSDT